MSPATENKLVAAAKAIEQYYMKGWLTTLGMAGTTVKAGLDEIMKPLRTALAAVESAKPEGENIDEWTKGRVIVLRYGEFHNCQGKVIKSAGDFTEVEVEFVGLGDRQFHRMNLTFKNRELLSLWDHQPPINVPTAPPPSTSPAIPDNSKGVTSQCEGCGKPAEGRDLDDVPLCRACAGGVMRPMVSVDGNRLTVKHGEREVCVNMNKPEVVGSHIGFMLIELDRLAAQVAEQNVRLEGYDSRLDTQHELFAKLTSERDAAIAQVAAKDGEIAGWKKGHIESEKQIDAKCHVIVDLIDEANRAHSELVKAERTAKEFASLNTCLAKTLAKRNAELALLKKDAAEVNKDVPASDEGVRVYLIEGHQWFYGGSSGNWFIRSNGLLDKATLSEPVNGEDGSILLTGPARDAALAKFAALRKPAAVSRTRPLAAEFSLKGKPISEEQAAEIMFSDPPAWNSTTKGPSERLGFTIEPKGNSLVQPIHAHDLRSQLPLAMKGGA